MTRQTMQEPTPPRNIEEVLGLTVGSNLLALPLQCVREVLPTVSGTGQEISKSLGLFFSIQGEHLVNGIRFKFKDLSPALYTSSMYTLLCILTENVYSDVDDLPREFQSRSFISRFLFNMRPRKDSYEFKLLMKTISNLSFAKKQRILDDVCAPLSKIFSEDKLGIFKAIQERLWLTTYPTKESVAPTLETPRQDNRIVLLDLENDEELAETQRALVENIEEIIPLYDTEAEMDDPTKTRFEQLFSELATQLYYLSDECGTRTLDSTNPSFILFRSIVEQLPGGFLKLLYPKVLKEVADYSQSSYIHDIFKDTVVQRDYTCFFITVIAMTGIRYDPRIKEMYPNWSKRDHARKFGNHRLDESARAHYFACIQHKLVTEKRLSFANAVATVELYKESIEFEIEGQNSKFALAVKEKNWSRAKQCIAQGSDPNYSVNKQLTVLSQAAKSGDVESMRHILDLPGVDIDALSVNCPDGCTIKGSLTALDCASTREAIELLLNNGAHVYISGTYMSRNDTLIELLLGSLNNNAHRALGHLMLMYHACWDDSADQNADVLNLIHAFKMCPDTTINTLHAAIDGRERMDRFDIAKLMRVVIRAHRGSPDCEPAPCLQPLLSILTRREEYYSAVEAVLIEENIPLPTASSSLASLFKSPEAESAQESTTTQPSEKGAVPPVRILCS